MQGKFSNHSYKTSGFCFRNLDCHSFLNPSFTFLAHQIQRFKWGFPVTCHQSSVNFHILILNFLSITTRTILDVILLWCSSSKIVSGERFFSIQDGCYCFWLFEKSFKIFVRNNGWNGTNFAPNSPWVVPFQNCVCPLTPSVIQDGRSVWLCIYGMQRNKCDDHHFLFIIIKFASLIVYAQKCYIYLYYHWIHLKVCV